MIRRVTDPSFSNLVANHRDVRPWLGGKGWLDTGPMIEDPRNFAFQAEHGIVFFHRLETPGAFELHYHFLPSGWGWEPRLALDEALWLMFRKADCDLIGVRTAADNPKSRRLIERAGFRFIGTQAGIWPTKAGPVDMANHQLTRLEWADSHRRRA